MRLRGSFPTGYRWRVAAALALVLALPLFLAPGSASAHPLGNFTINRYTRIEVDSRQVRLRYVLDMAEIPTFQEMASIDLDGDGQASEMERARYREEKVEALRRGVHLSLDGEPLELRVAPGSAELRFLPGQADLPILHLSAWFEAALLHHTPGREYALEYRDGNYANRLGWKEIVARPLEGVSLLQSSIPPEDLSNELLSYPQDLLRAPLEVTRAQLTFKIVPIAEQRQGSGAIPTGEAVGAPDRADPLAMPLKKADRGFASLISRKKLTIPVIFLSLVVAMFWGAAHALSPGHGKTVVAAYLVGSRGTPKHAAFLALTVTLTHTSSVFALGLVTLFASHFILPEDLFPWLELTSGLLVVGLGLWLLRSRLRSADLLGLLRLRGPGETQHLHSHGHDHSHPRGGFHYHEHAGLHGHPHHPADDDVGEHEHSHREHSHLPPGADGTKLGWRSLLALGVSGGLLPCPSAIVVMLSAISLDRVGFGLVLILAFSAGLAATLGALGLLALFGGRLLGRLSRPGRLSSLSGLAVRLFPVGSAAFIAAVGAVLTARAVPQLG